MVDGSRGSVGYGTKVDTATVALRGRIVTGEFPPGAHLRQDELALLLGQSRVPIREALKTLTAENIVVHKPNRGHFVAELTAAEMSDVCWMREVLEAELARTARVPSSPTVARLEAMNRQLESAADARPADFVELDDQLHEVLWRLSPRWLLIEELRRVANQQRPYRVLLSRIDPERDSGAVGEHHEIIEALRVGDLVRYQALLGVHVARGRGMIAALRRRNGTNEGGPPPVTKQDAAAEGLTSALPSE